MRKSQLSTEYMAAWLTCAIGTIPGTAATISFGYMRVAMLHVCENHHSISAQTISTEVMISVCFAGIRPGHLALTDSTTNSSV